MKATLDNGTILEGEVTEIKEIMRKLQKHDVQNRTSYRKTELVNERPPAPKRSRRRKNSQAQIKHVANKYGINEEQYRKAVMDKTRSFDEIAKNFRIGKHHVAYSRKLLRNEGIITFAYAKTQKREKMYRDTKMRMGKAAALVNAGKAKNMVQALHLLKKK